MCDHRFHHQFETFLTSILTTVLATLLTTFVYQFFYQCLTSWILSTSGAGCAVEGASKCTKSRHESKQIKRALPSQARQALRYSAGTRIDVDLPSV